MTMMKYVKKGESKHVSTSIIHEQAWDIFVHFKSVCQETRKKEDTGGHCVISYGSDRPPNYALIRYSYCKLSLIFIGLDWIESITRLYCINKFKLKLDYCIRS